MTLVVHDRTDEDDEEAESYPAIDTDLGMYLFEKITDFLSQESELFVQSSFGCNTKHKKKD